MSGLRRTVGTLAATLAVTATTLLGGCAAVTPTAAAGGPVTPVRPEPAGTTVVTGPTSDGGSAPDCGDPTASLAPTGPLPAPGAMPPGSTMDRIVQRGVLVVGVDQSTVPFGYRDPATGALTGFDISVARQMAQAILGDATRVNFRVESSSQRIPNLLAGDVDMVVQTMTATCARRAQIDFSSVYFEARQRVLLPRASSAQGLADLGGRPVCSIAGSTSIDAVATAPSRPVTVSVPEKSDCLVLLQQGQVDAVSTDDTILAGFATEDRSTEIRGPTIAGEPYAIGIAPQNTDLVRFVNGVLDRMRTDGTWARIYASTPALTALGPVPAPPAPRYRG